MISTKGFKADRTANQGRTVNFIARSLFITLVIQLGACSYIIDKQTNKLTDNLTQTILNFEDPATIKEATPTFIVLIDSMARHDDSSGETQMAAAQMYGSFAGAFVSNPKRQKRLSEKAFFYAQAGSCKLDERWCNANTLTNNEFIKLVDDITTDNLTIAYDYSVAWLGYIQTHADDWAVVAQLAKSQQILEKVVLLDEAHDNAGPHLYLGAIESTLPPALGGKPDIAKAHFDRGIEITQGKSLLIKVEYARRYARNIFDKDLHHQLLTDVLAADPKKEGLTLMNSWAQDQAQLLLDDENNYFD